MDEWIPQDQHQSRHECTLLCIQLYVGPLVHVQILLQLEPLAAAVVVAYPLLLLGVGLFVSLERAFLHEFFTADVAFEGLLPRVRPYVPSQRPAGGELLQTGGEGAVLNLAVPLAFV